jgi:hypothetical protein
MSGSPKEKLQTHTEEVSTEDAREVYLRDGRKLVISDAGTDQLVEVRSESGMVEVRIRLTEQGPVLQMEAVRLQLKAEEKVEIESKRVEIKGTETVAVDGGKVTVEAKEEGIEIDAEGAVRVVGKTIHLN